MINIGHDKKDPSYRYKMPKLQTKVIGRGNGLQTIIPNMAAIAKALHVDVRYPTKFFGFELGTQSKFDDQKGAILNGMHSSMDLQVLLEKYICAFVLCPTCGLPELRHIRTKAGKIQIDCNACGHSGVRKSKHKLVRYMSMQEPRNTTKKSQGQVTSCMGVANRKNNFMGTATEASSKAMKVTALATTTAAAPALLWHTDTSAAAQQARWEEEFNLKPAPMTATGIATAATAVATATAPATGAKTDGIKSA